MSQETTTASPESAPRRIGRYVLYGPIASGGMATVHYGMMVGDAGFSRVVAIKRVRADKRKQADHASSLLDEARLASRVQHPNVVPPLDVFWHERELLVVLEYVAGESLSRLLRETDRREERIPLQVGASVVAQVLHGLHAAHDAKSARGKPLGIVHRDVSPQNILVGRDGLARVLDFGIAKATERLSSSVVGQVKGKLAYMAPEQLQGRADRRTDIYAAAVVLWEVLAGRRLFHGKTSRELFDQVVKRDIRPPSEFANLSPELDELVMRGLEREPEERYETARHFALAIEAAVGVASSAQIGDWVEQVAGRALSDRAAKIAQLEREVTRDVVIDDPSFDAASTVAGSSGVVSADPSEVLSTPTRAVPPKDPAPETPQETLTVPLPGHRSAQDLTEVDHDAEDAEATDEREEATMPAVSLSSAVASSPVVAPADVWPPAEPPRASRWRWVAAVMLVGVGGLAAWWLVPRDTPPTAATRAPRPAPSPSGLPQMAPPGPPAPSVTVPSPTPTGSPVSSASASAKPPRPPAPLPPPRAPTPSSPKAPPDPPANADCIPPYTIDARGIRHLKPQCL